MASKSMLSVIDDRDVKILVVVVVDLGVNGEE